MALQPEKYDQDEVKEAIESVGHASEMANNALELWNEPKKASMCSVRQVR